MVAFSPFLALYSVRGAGVCPALPSPTALLAVAINPLALWPNMPPGGDAKEWIDHCFEEGISLEEMIRSLSPDAPAPNTVRIR